MSSQSNTLSHHADKLISRLDGVIARGPGQFYARCPAHDDKSPSLSISEAEDKILIHCFAGCPAEDVLTAVDLTWTDLYPDRWQAAYRGATAAKLKKPKEFDPLEVERWVLKIAANHIEQGVPLTVEDLARIEVARLRLKAWRDAA